jgi:2,4-dienoyl-CoA reductase-like NADH-dependent reductase (Old Yellow Enzyme family)
VSPLNQCSSEDVFANNWHLVYLGSRTVGGSGLIMLETTAVPPVGGISPQDMGIWKQEHIPLLKTIVDFLHSQKFPIGIQLTHAGRKPSTFILRGQMLNVPSTNN